MKKLATFVLVMGMTTALAFVSCQKAKPASGTQAETAPAAGAQSDASAAGQTTLRWAFWGNDTRIKLTQEAVDAYMKQNPNVKVNIEPSGGTGDMFTRVDTQLAGGNGPDIIQMGGNWPDYARRNVILPLEGYNGKGLDLKSLDQGAIDAVSQDGHLYGISVGIAVQALIYNKTLLQKYGAPLPNAVMSYDEFFTYIKQVQAKLPAGIYAMSDYGWQASNSTPFGYWLRYNQTPIYTAKTNTSAVTADVAAKYYTLWKSYRDAKVIPPIEVAAEYPANGVDQTNDFVVGKTCMTWMVSNQLASFQGVMTDELGLIAPPGANASWKPMWPGLSQVMTVNKDSKNIDEAVKFINFIVNSPEAGAILGSNRGSPASSTYRAGMKSNKTDDIVNAYLNTVSAFMSPETDHLPHDTELNTTGFLIYQQVAYGQSTIAKGSADLANLVQTLIKK